MSLINKWKLIDTEIATGQVREVHAREDLHNIFIVVIPLLGFLLLVLKDRNAFFSLVNTSRFMH